MKKLALIAFAALTALAFAGCADNGEVGIIDNQKVSVSLTAGIEPAPPTRTDFSDPANPVWSEGDAIGIHLYSKTQGMMHMPNTRFEGVFEPDYSKATFTGAFTQLDAGEYSVTGYYPHAGLGDGTTLEAEAKIEIPAIQRPTSTSFDPMADIMVMKPFDHNHDGSISISRDDLMFKRVLGIIRIRLNSEALGGQAIERLTFTTDDPSLNLAGKANFDLVEGEFGGFYADATTSVTAEPAGNIYANGTDVILLCVPVMTIGTGVEMTITGETAGYTFTTSKIVEEPIQLEPGNYHTMNVTTLSVTPKEVVVAKPSDLAYSDLTTTSVTLSWSHADAEYYELAIGDLDVVRLFDQSYEATELTPETEYEWKVRARKDAVWSEWAEGETFTTNVEFVRQRIEYVYMQSFPAEWYGEGTINFQLTFAENGLDELGFELYFDFWAKEGDYDEAKQYIDIPQGTYVAGWESDVFEQNGSFIFMQDYSQYYHNVLGTAGGGWGGGDWDYQYGYLGGGFTVQGDHSNYHIEFDLILGDGSEIHAVYDGPFEDIGNPYWRGY